MIWSDVNVNRTSLGGQANEPVPPMYLQQTPIPSVLPLGRPCYVGEVQQPELREATNP